GITLTNTVTLTYGAAYKVAIIRQAAGAVNGVAFATQPQAVIQDISGNTVDTTDSIDVTSSGATLGGTTSIAAVNGKATFTNLKLTGTVASYTLTFTSGALATDSQSIALTFGAATKLVVTTQPLGFVNRTNFTTQPVVTVQDASGNTVESSAIWIDVTIDSGSLTGTTRIAAVNGVATFAGLGKYGTTGSKTLTFSKVGGGLTVDTSTFTLTYGAIDHLDVAVANTIANDTAWSTQPIVTIQDQDGNTVADQNQTVSLAATGATLGGTTSMNAVNGVADFAGKGLKLTGAIGSKTLTASISSPSSFSTPVTISLTYGVATKLVLTTQPAGFVNRANFTTQPAVTVQDVSGNTVTNAAVSVDVAIDSGSLSGTTRVAAVNGVATFAGLGKYGTIGSKTLTFSDSAATLTADSFSFTLTHGASDHLGLVVASTLVNNTAFATQPVVTIYDRDENVVTSGAESTQSVSLAATGATTVALGGTSSMNAVAGVANFSGKGVKLTGTIGSKTLTSLISSPSSITKSATINITYGAADHVSIATSAASAANGAAFGTQPVIEIRDVSENVVTNSTLTVTASVSSGTLSGTTQIQANAGVATYTDLGLTATAGTKTLTFAAANITSATQSILAVTGAPTHLRIDVAGTLVNNTAFATQPVVTLLDSTETVVSVGGYSTQTVTLSSPDATIAGTLSMAAVAGIADFNGKGIKLTGIAGAHNLTATIAQPSSITETVPVTITFGAAHHLNINAGATGATSRVAFTGQPVVEVLDISGNRVGDSTASVAVSATGANGAVLGGDLSMNAVGGIAYFAQN
ncbi:MAG: beta strand repeat-containing protein, partial [Rhodoluna sp.]